ncbi:MAG: 6,7-dimethyl-8-ribityllumazine synthase [bacterium]
MRHSRPEFKLEEILENLYLENIRIALVIANWNIGYNQEMADSATETLIKFGIRAENIDSYYTPGAFEMPYACQKLFEKDLEDDEDLEDHEAGENAEIGVWEQSHDGFTGYHAVICFATIIRGETYHFEIVANESARGIMDVMLDYSKPIINGVLTVNTEEQALARASVTQDDKGKELALSCLQVLGL